MSARPAIPPDSALLDALARGDAGAFRTLYVRHQPRVHRLAWATLLDEVSAADVTQEVFVRLHLEAARLSRDTRLEAWLCTVTLNAALSWRRTLLRFRRPWVATRVHGDDPEHRAALNEGIAVLRAGLEALPPKQRAVATLHLDASMSPSEVAEVMGVTPNDARVTLHRALTTLRATLAAAGLDPTTLGGVEPQSLLEESP